eukprot:3720727-Pleurochrysis_carterae.AAC.1
MKSPVHARIQSHSPAQPGRHVCARAGRYACVRTVTRAVRSQGHEPTRNPRDGGSHPAVHQCARQFCSAGFPAVLCTKPSGIGRRCAVCAGEDAAAVPVLPRLGPAR